MDDIDPSWVFVEWNPPEFISRIPPLSLNWTLKAGTITRMRIQELERSGKKFDAFFVNHLIPVVFLKRFRQRIPVVMSLDTTPVLLNRYASLYLGRNEKQRRIFHGLKHAIAKSIYHDAAGLLPWSNLVRESLISDYNVPVERLTVVPPGINLRLWDTSHPKKRQREDHIRILFVGADFQRKGGDLLLELAGRDEYRNCEFHFVTKSFVGTRGDNVIVHDMLKPNSDELISLYRSSDIFALPTRADLSPNAICEAMAAGVPVVSTDIGAIREQVLDNETGFLVSANDISKFSERLLLLVREEDTRLRFGEQGRRRVESNFDLETAANTIVGLLKNTVDLRRKSYQ